MRIQKTTDSVLAEQIIDMLKANDWYCPCKIEHLVENRCICEDMRERVPVGEYCHCGLYKKIED